MVVRPAPLRALLPWLLLPAIAACGGAHAQPAGSPGGAAVDVRLPASAVAASDPEAGPIPVTAADPTWGNPDALVTLVQFGDFTNAFCAQDAVWIRAIQRQYRPEVLRIVWKGAPQPWSPASKAAAAAAQAVFAAGGARAFWSFYDAAFASPPPLTAARFERWAARAGVPSEAYRRALADPATARKVEADLALAGALEVTPPQVLVNGALVLGISSLDAITGAIDAEWDEAEAAVGRGVPRARIHAERARENLARSAGRTPAERIADRAGDAEPEPEPPQEPAAKEMFAASHLLVMYAGSRRAPATVTRTKAEARALAEKALIQAHGGTPFGDVVALYSDEPGAAARRGDLGKFSRGMMVPEFEAAVIQTPVGKMSGVFETPFGFHVLLRTQ